ncbi:MAG: SH3 domain-containing protein [Pseudomonadota bacterium]
MRYPFIPIATMALALLLVVNSALAQNATRIGETGFPIPRMVSLASNEINVRTGPGLEYPIKWVFGRKGYPVKIVDEFDVWRKIEDHEGEQGWVHSRLLTSQRMVFFKDQIEALRRTPELDSRIVVRAEPGVVGELLYCRETWCLTEIEGTLGWIQGDRIWGVLPHELAN